MKPIKILLIFLGLFTLSFIPTQFHPFGLFKSGEPYHKQLFSSLFQSLNFSTLFTFIYFFGEIKKIESLEEFKAQRKKLVISVFLFTSILSGVLWVTESWVLKHRTDWINSILFSLIWAVISVLLTLLFLKRMSVNETDNN